jgi:hypothetical protein
MNRVLGIIFTIVAIAAMVFAILNWGNYKSLCFTKAETESEEVIPVDEVEMEIIEEVTEEPTPIVEEEVMPTEQADSLANS